MPDLEGTADGQGLRLAIVASRFHAAIVEGLLAGARGALAALGVRPQDLTVVRVPGALELPLATRRVAAGGAHAAVIVLGAVIRGETDHYDFVCAGAMRGCTAVSDETGVPVLMGLLTCETLAQALARSVADEANKGAEAARAAVEMANLCRLLDGPGRSSARRATPAPRTARTPVRRLRPTRRPPGRKGRRPGPKGPRSPGSPS